MPTASNIVELQLKVTCQLTGACWAVWMDLQNGEWILGSKYALGKGREAALRSFLAHPKESSWLAGALSGGRTRLRSLHQPGKLLGCDRIYAFPALQGSRVLLVGADALAEQARGFFRVLAMSEMPVQAYHGREYALPESADARKQVDSNLIRSARLAAVGEMAAGLAHELNNPLTTVTGFVELVLEELPSESPQRADLELVLRESRRARDVVRQLLDFSHPQEDVRQSVDLNQLVFETLSLVKHWANSQAVTITFIQAENLPPINLDANQIKQVLVNLVHNGLQAMPSGGDLAVYTGEQTLDDRPGVMFKVCDNGEGIPSEHLDCLFEPFFTTRPPGSGTGLGLSVSYGIVNNHAGVIEVDSQVGVGSTFTVWLPLEGSEAKDA